jgi:predicted dehydrogenase
VAGLTSRTPPTPRRFGQGAGSVTRVFESVRELAANVDVIAVFNASSVREVMEEIAPRSAARLARLICEKPLARTSRARW